MAHCKNVEGGPSDEDPMPPPRLTAQQKGKVKKTTKKKRKFDDVEAERAAVAAATERAERGGSGSGICIDDQLSPAQRAAIERIEASIGSPPGTITLGGRRVSLEDTPKVSHAEESQTQGVTKQQTQSAEQIEDAQ